jgi:uroporphyrinogen decarboxylase
MKSGREHIRKLIAGQEVDHCSFWLGNPHPDSWPGLKKFFKESAEEAIRRKLGDEFRWIEPSISYRHPSGKPIFDVQRHRQELGAGGIFANCKDVEEVYRFAWPNPDYLDFQSVLDQLKKTGDFYRASGFWCPFFHDVAEFLGMENYFLKMLVQPEIVYAITDKVVEFYLEANRRLFWAAGDEIDGFFFGNDFGTQLDLLLSPELLKNFIFPYMAKLIDGAKSFNKQIIFHSCGSIFKLIPDFISIGVEALHPLQAKAVNMDAITLKSHFAGKIAFIGGIDTQEILVHGNREMIKNEVRRVKSLLGPRLIISPSHEAILPDIPPQNIEAMAQAVWEE